MSPRSFITEVLADDDAGAGCNAERPCGTCGDCLIAKAIRTGRRETRDEERARLAYEREHSAARLG
jgi:hypothetical protein